MDQVEEIKEKIDIVEFINARIPLKRAGRNFKALCPFHQEKTPSFFVNPERQIWYCFGACDEGGDVISFLQKYESIDFPEALRILADEAGVKLQRRDFGSAQSKKKEELYRLNNLVSEYYHYLLTEHKVGNKARKYLTDRGVKDKTIKTFKLGYAPDAWEGLLAYLRRKKYQTELIEEGGLAIKSSYQKGYYDRFRGRVIFPLMDHRGNIVGFSGRTLRQDVKEAKYINTPETPIYQKRATLYGLALTGKAIRRENAAIIAEGEFDVISSFQIGVSNIVAVKGSGLTEDQIRLLKRYTDKLILALDADKAGDQAIRRGVILADEAGLDVRVVTLEGGKDPDEIIRQDPTTWRKAIKKPVVFFDYVITSAIKRQGVKSGHAKQKIIEELAHFFALSQNPIVRAHYARKLAAKIDLPESVVIEAIEEAEKKIKVSDYRPRRLSREKVQDKKRQQTRWQLLEEHILSILLQAKDPNLKLSIVEKILPLEQMPQAAAVKVISQLRKHLAGKKTYTAAEFIKALDKELIPVADRAFMLDIKSLTGDEVGTKAELQMATRQLRLLILRRQLSQTTARLKDIQAETDDEAELKKLNKKITNLSREIKLLMSKTGKVAL